MSRKDLPCATCKGPNPREHTYCVPCNRTYQREWRRKNADKYRESRKHYRRKLAFNLERADYEEMLEKQNHVCAICKQPQKGRSLAVDHCHKIEKETGEIFVRGLLCGRCNVSLGAFEDNIELLKEAINYLGGNNE
jgi:hypothetical protein